MKIINKTNQKLITDKVKIANNVFSRMIGLLNRSNLEQGEGLLIIPCNSIHSIGMKFNFDAVFLDKNNKVQHLIKDIKPWKVLPVIFSAHSTLELPAGTIDIAEIKVNDYLEFITE
jgi:uncharacterized membrane protein (UPF0127 family)